MSDEITPTEREDLHRQLRLIKLLNGEQNHSESRANQRVDLIQDIKDVLGEYAIETILSLLAHALAQTEALAGVKLEAQLFTLNLSIHAALKDKAGFDRTIREVEEKMPPVQREIFEDLRNNFLETLNAPEAKDYIPGGYL